MMTKRHGKKGKLGSFKDELDDVFSALAKRNKKLFIKENKERMSWTRRWAKRYAKKKKPSWTSIYWSYKPEIIKLMRGYYSAFPKSYATRLRKTKTKQHGTRYYLDIYDTVSRQLR